MTGYTIKLEVQVNPADSLEQARKDVETAIIKADLPAWMEWMIIDAAPLAPVIAPATRWATFVGQAWINGHTMEVDDSRVSYGVTDEEFDENGGDEPADFDALAQAARAPDWVRNWSGPFDIYISDIPDGQDPDIPVFG
ncbi:hypothetical protein HOU02_gp177 [Caulobacter phage CcrBL9]|uniref:Uncharacterized protein n=1 Tax=Caulobacter phage CcrBL9 TaxID=2283270 RepID=A0A385EFJ9_9CAUD|nr:hypothetical protein HOU02_gp008 [Caulobacter phage CcrBL9]YP_009810178.1 hypothetical protein HOU02_gp177 [Caulobacter phage CcrBL9]AXQ69032.1 hypothetical protein CcrBL9_gp008 [Caulobacter phage CcrBL9]AXQ69548.1 hypothetical protein CcrBL9_gp524 [Caulobacter phage CcrBL9]